MQVYHQLWQKVRQLSLFAVKFVKQLQVWHETCQIGSLWYFSFSVFTFLLVHKCSLWQCTIRVHSVFIFYIIAVKTDFFFNSYKVCVAANFSLLARQNVSQQDVSQISCPNYPKCSFLFICNPVIITQTKHCYTAPAWHSCMSCTY